MIQVIIDDSIRARLRCLTIFSTKFQLNRGDQFHRWRKQGCQEKKIHRPATSKVLTNFIT